MRKTIGVMCGLLVLVLAGAWMGAATLVFDGTVQSPWKTDTITATAAALGLTERNATFVGALTAAQTAIIEPSERCNYLQIRFRKNGNLDVATTVQVYASRGGADSFAYLGATNIQSGSQLETGSIYFVDSITTSSLLYWGATISSTNTSVPGNDQIATLKFDTLGYRKFLFLIPTLGGTATTYYVDWAEF